RAGFILDNLIAAKKAKPMIVVMPAGHTSRSTANAIGQSATEEFVSDFVKDVMPYVEKNYRVLADRPHRAIAGLSMGGSQTLHIAFLHLDDFAYIGVFSSGASLGGGGRTGAPPADAAAAPPTADWEGIHKADLDNAVLKKGV